MLITCLSLAGLKVIQPRVFADERGCFWESYRQPIYSERGIAVRFIQDNCSVSRINTIRGLHYQPGQAKLICVLHGAIWDVVVDIRPESATFGQYEAVQLDDRERRLLFIPEGFAHGFCALSQEAIVHYKVSEVYNAASEGSIRWNDPTLQIAWPCKDPILSMRDQTSPFFSKELFL